jgi:hypothetical protein
MTIIFPSQLDREDELKGENKQRRTLLVGSLNLPSREAVFDAVSRHLKDDVRAVPDGETGDRGTWAVWAANRLEQLSDVATVHELVFHNPIVGPVRLPILAPVEGVDPSGIDFGSFGYAQEAVASYEAFRRDRDQGRFGDDTRFQVSLPTPMMFAMHFPGHRREVLGGLEQALVRDISQMLENIPEKDVAIQWDVAGEVASQEQFRVGTAAETGESQWPFEEATESIAPVSKTIPEAVLVGVHLCYGDPEGRHIIEPPDLSLCVEMSNSLTRLFPRRLDWVHMPVPVDRDDDDYFAPLAQLDLCPETELYLGPLHKEDGVEGATRRIARAAAYRQDFGVATECGMGREKADDIEPLLALHHEVGAGLAR